MTRVAFYALLLQAWLCAQTLERTVELFDRSEKSWQPSPMRSASLRFAALDDSLQTETSAYWAAVGDFHLAQLYLYSSNELQNKTLGRAALERCKIRLEKAQAKYPQNAEMQAMLATVLGMRIALAPWTAITQGTRVNQFNRQALALDSLNPRIRYLAGVNLVFTPELFGGGILAGRAHLQRAVAIFQNEKGPPTVQTPRWGERSARGFIVLSWIRAGDYASAKRAAQQCLAVQGDNQICKHGLEQSLKELSQ